MCFWVIQKQFKCRTTAGSSVKILPTFPRGSQKVSSCAITLLHLGLPDILYFTGAPVFQPQSPASRNEATREISLTSHQSGSHQYTDCTSYIEIHI